MLASLSSSGSIGPGLGSTPCLMRVSIGDMRPLMNVPRLNLSSALAVKLYRLCWLRRVLSLCLCFFRLCFAVFVRCLRVDVIAVALLIATLLLIVAMVAGVAPAAVVICCVTVAVSHPAGCGPTEIAITSIQIRLINSTVRQFP